MSLTDREFQVRQRDGVSNMEVAASLHGTESAVKNLAKLHLRNRAEVLGRLPSRLVEGESPLNLGRGQRVLAILVWVALLAGFAGCSRAPTSEEFLAARQACERAAAHLDNGDVEAAERVFMQEADPFLHRLDPLLRERDPALAEELWDTMGRIELAFWYKTADPASLAGLIRRSIPLLDQAARRFNSME